ncbi:multiple sugar transport system permease protein [Saccharothrix ecbatanensis]|uniref:Multiple sugar transport system permease protein n=1 Tax=Saccharothrix ecbatanensis TaxID=1105145 RepID=A0A7W9M142_9PSEU|nr:sugar ABC transporter permease [Saccharothrix ecbatanensis]MBB5803488.1 multiple sugar transport system permease protein [Saccharothrix ecbatanensis]
MTTERWAAIGFLAPLIAYLVAFYIFPLYRNIELSLHDYTPVAFVTGNARFVGFDNFIDMFTSRTFSTALRNTVLFTLISIAFQFTIGLGLAVYFRKVFPLSRLLRALFLVPWLLPLIVSGSTWAWLLNSESGIVNAALRMLGMDPVNWLVSPDTALTSVIIANIWLGIPFNLVVLYSGLQNIPGDVYEAALVDGASAWRTFWSVTLPLLKPVAAITLLLGFVYTLKVVDIIWIMTAGGPGDSSTTFATWSYREAFGTGNPEFSPAAAVGNVLILIALTMGAIYLRTQRRMDAS